MNSSGALQLKTMCVLSESSEALCTDIIVNLYLLTCTLEDQGWEFHSCKANIISEYIDAVKDYQRLPKSSTIDNIQFS